MTDISFDVCQCGCVVVSSATAVAELKADNERLQAALKFYANPENWESVWDHQFKMMVQEPVYRDKGDIARAALGGEND